MIYRQNKILDIEIRKLQQSSPSPTRDKIQKMAVAISKYEDNLFLNFPTRMGKAKAAMDICSFHKANKVFYGFAQTVHIENFIADSEKFNIDISNYDLSCWQSYHKYNDDYDIVIIDEFDVALDQHLSFLKRIKYKKLILLSATIQKEQEIRLQPLNLYKWTITLSDAIEWGILPKPIIKLRPIEMSPIEKDTFDNINAEILKLSNIIKRNKMDIFNELGTETQIQGLIKKNEYMMNMILRQGLNRKKLCEAIKLKWFIKNNVFEHLKDKRTIFFLPDIKKSKELGNAISSLESSKTNDKLLECFNNRSINYLISNKILIRGVNLYGIQYSYIGFVEITGDSIEQQLGRVLLGIAPIVIIPYVVGTKEETKVLQTLTKFKLI